ncbi:MAG TPA: glycosyltransferase, partial [Nitrospirae bacterium]|nr:glycosyltransferase [Nitrospirota bacterium]
RRELDALKDSVDLVIADSRFNAIDLETRHSYQGIVVSPLIKNFTRYDGKNPNPERLVKWRSDKKTILFIGRITANKRIDRLIQTLAVYVKLYGPDIRLVVPGSWKSNKPHKDSLLKLIARLGLEGLVELPGFIDDDDFIALFSMADVYLSLSEHEGFGVPLLEAMYFKTPVVAYDACSIPEVMGRAGIKLHSNDPVTTAVVLRELFENNKLCSRIVSGQDERLKEFSRENIEPGLKKAFEPLL